MQRDDSEINTVSRIFQMLLGYIPFLHMSILYLLYPILILYYYYNLSWKPNKDSKHTGYSEISLLNIVLAFI